VDLRVTYERPQDLVVDDEQQFARGGLLVRVEAPAGSDRGEAVALTLASPLGTVTLEARVIQVLPGAGIAVGFDAASPALRRLIAAARAAGSAAGSPPVHECVDAPISMPTPTGRPAADADSFAHARRATQAEKIRMALHGSKEERAAILRDANRTLHKYVLRNPGLGLDEVAHIARMTAVSQELLVFIAGRREWVGRPEIAAALVRNPKTPTPVAIKLLASVSPTELRQLAKSNNIRDAIQRAARKKVLKR
jgi:hypothetical protein